MTTSPPEREEPPAPAFALRPETGADEAFRRALFAASRGPGWDQALIPPDLLAKIMEQQFHAQTQGYRATFPDARLEIVIVDSAPAGRLATHRAPGVLHLIDIAMTPERRGQGVGAAILRDLMGEARAAGAPLTLEVARDNLDAQRLYHRLGFALAGVSETHLALRWDPAA